MKKALITGAAGFLGYHLSRFLNQQGYELTLCDNFQRGHQDREFEMLCKQKGTTFLNLDLSKLDTFKQLGKSYDEVYHLAAVNGTRFFYEKPHEVLRTNLLSTIYLLDWFIASDSKKLLFASSSETYSGTVTLYNGPIPTPENIALCISDIFNPRFSYAGSKIAGELLVVNYSRQYQFPMHIVRHHNIYGPRMGNDHVIPQFIQRTLSRENPFKIYGASNRRAFCYVSDAIQSMVQLMKENTLEGEVIHVGNSQEPIEMLQLAKKICDLNQWNPEFEIHPAPEGSVECRIPDTQKLEKGLQLRPQIDLTEGLRQTYEWFKQDH